MRADNVDHLTYLLQRLELELLDREKRAADRRLKAAKFPTIKTLENFDFTARPSVNKVLIAELARCEWIDKRENLLMIGNPGTGKSHLATALAAQACAKGYRVRFFRTTELVTTLIEARDERSFMRLKAQLARLDLLVFDELGYVPASKVGAELLFDVISTAYERTSLIVTSNLPFESWTEVLGSERLTGATLDRLTHRCQIIETRGESYRLTRRQGPEPIGQIEQLRPPATRSRRSRRTCGQLRDCQVASQPKCSRFRPARAPGFDQRSHRYHDALDVAFALLPEGDKPKRRYTGGWSTTQRAAWNLATRMRAHAPDVLRLLQNTAVPMDNNVAERSLRMVKLHDKISGSFRSDEGAQAFATIRSYLQTAALNGESRLAVLRQLFVDGPWLPAAGAT